jgi:hypothetical protein
MAGISAAAAGQQATLSIAMATRATASTRCMHEKRPIALIISTLPQLARARKT